MGERRDDAEVRKLVLRRALTAGRFTSVLLFAVILGVPSAVAAVVVTHPAQFTALFYGGIVAGTPVPFLGIKLVFAGVARSRRRAMFAIGWSFDAATYLENVSKCRSDVAVAVTIHFADPSRIGSVQLAVAGFDRATRDGDTVVVRTPRVRDTDVVRPVLRAAHALAAVHASHPVARFDAALVE